jgi:hypothetical protein
VEIIRARAAESSKPVPGVVLVRRDVIGVNVWLVPSEKEKRSNCDDDDKDHKKTWPGEYYVLAKGASISGAAHPPTAIRAISFRPVPHVLELNDNNTRMGSASRCHTACLGNSLDSMIARQLEYCHSSSKFRWRSGRLGGHLLRRKCQTKSPNSDITRSKRLVD